MAHQETAAASTGEGRVAIYRSMASSLAVAASRCGALLAERVSHNRSVDCHEVRVLSCGVYR